MHFFVTRQDLGSVTYSLKNIVSKANADSSDTSEPDMRLRAGLLPSLENSARQIDKLFQTLWYLNGFIAFHHLEEVCGTLKMYNTKIE